MAAARANEVGVMGIVACGRSGRISNPTEMLS
jgi:hypothetical protein